MKTHRSQALIDRETLDQAIRPDLRRPNTTVEDVVSLLKTALAEKGTSTAEQKTETLKRSASWKPNQTRLLNHYKALDDIHERQSADYWETPSDRSHLKEYVVGALGFVAVFGTLATILLLQPKAPTEENPTLEAQAALHEFLATAADIDAACALIRNAEEVRPLVELYQRSARPIEKRDLHLNRVRALPTATSIPLIRGDWVDVSGRQRDLVFEKQHGTLLIDWPMWIDAPNTLWQIVRDVRPAEETLLWCRVIRGYVPEALMAFAHQRYGKDTQILLAYNGSGDDHFPIAVQSSLKAGRDSLWNLTDWDQKLSCVVSLRFDQASQSPLGHVQSVKQLGWILGAPDVDVQTYDWMVRESSIQIELALEASALELADTELEKPKDSVMPYTVPDTSIVAASPMADETPPSSLHVNTARQALTEFLNAPDWQSKLPYVIDPERVRPQMEQYYRVEGKTDAPLSPDNFLYPKGALRVEDLERGIVAFVHKSTEQPMILFFKDAKLDWESYVQVKERRFEQFITNPQRKSQPFRVLMTRCFDPKRSVSENQNHVSFQISDLLHQEQLIHASVSRNSPLGQRLVRELDWGASRPAAVKLRWVGSLDTPRLAFDRLLCWELPGIGAPTEALTLSVETPEERLLKTSE